jgi:hypothetical protein
VLEIAPDFFHYPEKRSTIRTAIKTGKLFLDKYTILQKNKRKLLQAVAFFGSF